MKTLILSLFVSSLMPITAHAAFADTVWSQVQTYADENDACFERVTTLAEQTACVKDTNEKLNKYMESLLQSWYPVLRDGPRGTEALEKLNSSQTLWIQVRRDTCNFAAIAKNTPTTSKELSAFNGLHCVCRETIARIRELWPR